MRNFDPESFVDGLLGIGAAGGTGKSGEGKALAGRLQELRKARDERAKTRESERGSAGEMTLQEMDAPGQQTVMDAGNDALLKTPPRSSKNTASNKKKKRKKRKAKK